MARFIESVKYPGRNAHSSEIFQMFGVKGTKWPDAGMPVRFFQGIAVHVLPVDHLSLDKKPGVKSSKHRVIAACPDCGKAMSAGRLHQHVCAEDAGKLGIPAHKAPAFRRQLTELAQQMVGLEFGSEEQIDADNAFVELAQSFMTQGQRAAWDAHANKATDVERAEYAFTFFGMRDEWATIKPRVE